MGNAWNDVYDIAFKFNKGAYDSKSCQQLISFDIETSSGWRQPDGSVIGFNHFLYKHSTKYQSMIDNGQPVSVMYVWQMAIEDGNDVKVFMGRTWDEFDDFLHLLTGEIRRQSVYGVKCNDRFFETAHARKLKHNVDIKIFVHNLGFEFAALRNLYNKEFAGTARSEHVFARQSRKPMKAHFNINKVKVEWRDSLVLVQKSLDNWCKDENLPVKKIEVDKDFYLEIRTPYTELTQLEIDYAQNDVISMIYGLKKYRDKYGSLGAIPLTQTGEVRRQLRKVSKENPMWAKQCYDVTTSYTPEEFKRLAYLFQGGWTHGNKMVIGDVLHDVKCFDFASSYPAVMTTRKFPLEKFIECDIDEFGYLECQDIHDADWRWYMKVELTNVKSKLDNSYWSLSKVAFDENNPVSGQIVDNGRIYSCSHMIAYMTDLDWDTFKQCYYFEDVNVMSLYKSKAGYFPTEMIETILDYFQYKTSLKGIDGSESLYNESKQFINSCYGVMVTKIISAIVSFGKDGWDSKEPDDHTFMEMLHQTKEEDSFTEYQAGVWVTAWARHNLFDFIINLDEHIAYCDTDSIKGTFDDNDLKFIENYNKNIESIENNVASVIGIDPSRYTAKTSKGKIKRLGIMEREDDCEEFCTLGAKRYVDKVNGNIECTIAGLPKSAAKRKIKSVDEFKDGLIWHTDESEKLMARYCDNMKPSYWKDRNGQIYYSKDKYGVCLQPTTFELSISEEFSKFLDLLHTGIINREDEFFADTPAWFFK